MRVIDCFLFHKELDILELRIEYLYDYVDKFIILESHQEFTGKPKPFYLEAELNERFKKFKNKIIYFKNEIFLNSYNDLIQYNNDRIISEITKLIENQKHFNKDILRYLIDTFQREMLRYPICQNCSTNDKIMISDVDEIPSRQFIQDLKFLNENQILIQKHHEFKFFIDNYSHSNWVGGTIACSLKNLLNYSFNQLRQDAKKKRIKNSKISKSYGYHLTFFGGVKSISDKISSYAHQEFNLEIILDNINSIIKNNDDIFLRPGENTQNIYFNENKYLDDDIKKYISKNKIFFNNINAKKIDFFKRLIIKFQIALNKIFKKIKGDY